MSRSNPAAMPMGGEAPRGALARLVLSSCGPSGARGGVLVSYGFTLHNSLACVMIVSCCGTWRGRSSRKSVISELHLPASATHVLAPEPFSPSSAASLAGDGVLWYWGAPVLAV